MVLSLLLVTGAVLFGVFGPGIAQRSMLWGGASVADLVSALADIRDRLRVDALMRGRRPAIDPGVTEAAGEALTERERAPLLERLREIAGEDATLPDLGAEGFALVNGGEVTDSRVRPGGLALGFHDRTAESFALLYFFKDEGHYLVFDSLGRPTPLVPDRAYSEMLERSRNDQALAVVWSDGPVLRVLITDTEEDAARIGSALGMP